MSVIIPAYNAAPYIRQTLESISAQTYRRIEILVVDDGSQDDTSAIVVDAAKADPRIRLLRQENAGVGAARNRAIREAKGVYIAPSDADDIWHPQKIEAQVACMEANGPGTGFVYCWANFIAADGSFLGHCPAIEGEGDVSHLLTKGNFIPCASVPLFRTTALNSVGYYLTRAEQNGAQGCEDWDLSVRVAERYKVHGIRAHLVGYRQTNGLSLLPNAMIRSFEIVQRRMRERNAQFIPYDTRDAESSFYFWLALRCYVEGKFAQCMPLVAKVIASNMRSLLGKPVYSLLFKSGVGLILGPSGKKQPPAPPIGTPSVASMFPPSLS